MIARPLFRLSLCFLKCVLTQSADRADPAGGNVFPSSAGSHAVIRIPGGGVVLITAGADVFVHQNHSTSYKMELAEVALQQALESLSVAGLVTILFTKYTIS